MSRGYGFNHHNIVDTNLRDVAFAVSQNEIAAEQTASRATSNTPAQAQLAEIALDALLPDTFHFSSDDSAESA